MKMQSFPVDFLLFSKLEKLKAYKFFSEKTIFLLQFYECFFSSQRHSNTQHQRQGQATHSCDTSVVADLQLKLFHSNRGIIDTNTGEGNITCGCMETTRYKRKHSRKCANIETSLFRRTVNNPVLLGQPGIDIAGNTHGVKDTLVPYLHCKLWERKKGGVY